MLPYNPNFTTDLDPLFPEVAKRVLEIGKVSASLIQRQFKLGYARSARIVDELEQEGIIGPSNGAEPRQILVQPKKATWIVKEQIQSKWKRTKLAKDKTKKFQISLGRDENQKQVDLNLDKYGNLLIIGSQFTSAVPLLNNILATSMAKYSPTELGLIIIDGVRGDITVPNTATHLLTPIIVEPEKSSSALRWSIVEIERRSKSGNKKIDPKVLIVINSLNQIVSFAPSNEIELLYRITVQGKKHGFHLILGTDYPDTKTSKKLLANIPAKLVFRPTDLKGARDTGVPESINLTSPDMATLETIFEDKKTITVEEVDTQKIYKEIFR